MVKGFIKFSDLIEYSTNFSESDNIGNQNKEGKSIMPADRD